MPVYDQHVHSNHSWDCDSEPADNVRQAIERGLAGITFTEHFDTHPSEWSKCTYDDDAYSVTIRDLRERFGSEIFIGKGIEVCYQPTLMDFILDFLANHEFDLVILSVHFFGDFQIGQAKSWKGQAPGDVSRRYFDRVLEGLRFCERLHREQGPVFNVLGHLDLVKRYTQRFLGYHDVGPHRDQIDAILQACLAADVVPEINTSSLRQNLSETMPGMETVRSFAKLGGGAMSLGSDAHLAGSVGAGFDLALGMLHRAGITQQAVFKRRERLLVDW